MKKQLLLALCVWLGACCSCAQARREVDFRSRWDTVRVLKNPGKGWYHHLLDNGIEKYAIRDDSLFRSFPGMDHLYLRLAWSYLEPGEGRYDWHRIDEIVQKYVPLGFQISFRISSKETGTFPGSVGQQSKGVQYATPYWVAQAGAKGSIAENWGVKSWVPDWDDPVYLEKLDRFHRAFATRYDGKPWVRYIDVGSIGEWGEGHTHFSSRIPPTVAEVKANLDVFLRNYRKTRLVCTDDLLYYGKTDADTDTLFKYAVSNGISLRDDSPMVDWYVRNHLDTWTVSHPRFYDPLYLKSPIVFELEHYGTVKNNGYWLGKNGAGTIPKLGHSGAEIMRRAIETMHATYIGYHGFAEEWLADNPDLTKELANLCGYWYFPVTARFNPALSTGENGLSITWLNRGVAPAYGIFALLLRFAGAENAPSIDVRIEDSGNKNWLPDSLTTAEYHFLLPPNMAKGKYSLKFKLVKTSGSGTVPIELGLQKRCFDSEGFAELGFVSLRKGP